MRGMCWGKVLQDKLMTESNVTLLRIFIPNGNKMHCLGCFMRKEIQPSCFQTSSTGALIHCQHPFPLGVKIPGLNTGRVLSYFKLSEIPTEVILNRQ